MLYRELYFKMNNLIGNHLGDFKSCRNTILFYPAELTFGLKETKDCLFFGQTEDTWEKKITKIAKVEDDHR